jgi:hypothetical protein
VTEKELIMKATADQTTSPFEAIKRINEHGAEYWSARDLLKILEYNEFRKFKPVIQKAVKSLESSNINASDHIARMDGMVDLGSGAKRKVEDYQLSRYACYLIIQNADPSKPSVALGQSYFAIQTRKQELQDELDNQFLEEKRRIAIRAEIKKHNSKLAETAKNAGVTKPIDYAIFTNLGYQGLYGGLKRSDIAQRKGIEKGDILDHMGSTELAANLFRATQAEEKIRREQIKGKQKANQAHYDVGEAVRKTIKELGGEMPENLPPEENH